MTKDELMTEEQIKHNAEQYANRYEIRGTSDGEFRYMDKKDAYIAGAHSRDEEINLLRDTLQSEQEQSHEHIIELQKELNLLQNPWISVEDMLPKEGQPLVVVNKSGNRYCCYYNASIEEFVTIDPDGNLWNVCDVSHWMLIPELKKGE